MFYARPWSWLISCVAISAAALLAALQPAATTSVAAEPTSEAQAGVQPVEPSMHEFMEYVFEPGYKRLKAEMAKDEKDRAVWKAIKGDALSLAEASNLLLFRAPEEGGADWKAHAVATRTAGQAFYQAARAADSSSAASAWRNLLNQCNACHKQFANGKYQLVP